MACSRKPNCHHPSRGFHFKQNSSCSVIAQNIDSIKQRIREICAGCGRNPDEIRLVAVTKTHPEDKILEARQAGLSEFGENRVQELVPKMDRLPSDIVWHMVGTVQTNKIKDMVHRVDWIHSISKIKYLRELEKRASRIDRLIRVLIQVNISDEDQKSGCNVRELPAILEYAADLKHVSVHGLMGMASFTDDRDLVRRQFTALRQYRDEHLSYETDNVQLRELSMGMSGDYDIAIEEGATIIRLGSTIFGTRSSDQ